MKYVLILVVLLSGCDSKQKQCDPRYHSIQEFARANNLHFEVYEDNSGIMPWGVNFWSKGTHWWNDTSYCFEADHCWRAVGDTAEQAFANAQRSMLNHPGGNSLSSYKANSKCKE